MSMEEERLISGTGTATEDSQDRAIRPLTLQDYVGQEVVKEQMDIFISAARNRGEPLDHTLVFGPPGLGKTTLAYIIAHELQVAIRTTSGPVLEKAGDLAAMLTNLEAGDVLFIDEIHRLSPAIEEILYPAMEDFALDLMIGEGPSARSIRIDLPRFTLVGATTRTGLLTSPLRDRFGWSARLEYYPVSDLERIVVRSAGLLGFELGPGAAREVASRSRGTPRIANRLLRRVRDYAEVEEAKGVPVSRESAARSLDRLDVDEEGFDGLDRALLHALIEKFDGGPVGLETLAAAVGEDKGTIEDVVEPYLIYQGFLDRTPRGRVATRRAREHLGARELGTLL